MEDSFFGQKETGAERVAMATALRVSFCFLCDGQLWTIIFISWSLFISSKRSDHDYFGETELCSY